MTKIPLFLYLLQLSLAQLSPQRQQQFYVPPPPPDPCPCPKYYFPVCGSDGVTYDNYCFMYCEDGVTLKHEGKCKKVFLQHLDDIKFDPCICPAIYSPVCGVNGVTYSNDCQRKCAGVGLRHNGRCRLIAYPNEYLSAYRRDN